MPATLLEKYAYLFFEGPSAGPILDLASGSCLNGIYLARKGLQVVCCDRSREALECAKKAADEQCLDLTTWQVNLERKGVDPLPEDGFAGILVFHYLHRPLIPCIKKALKVGGILIYETYTVDQPEFGPPNNPDFLLQSGELRRWFEEWWIIHSWEGIDRPKKKAYAQLVCRKV